MQIQENYISQQLNMDINSFEMTIVWPDAQTLNTYVQLTSTTQYILDLKDLKDLHDGLYDEIN
jgi:hypothetical protein